MCKSQNSRAIARVVFSAKYTHPNILDIGLRNAEVGQISTSQPGALGPTMKWAYLHNNTKRTEKLNRLL